MLPMDSGGEGGRWDAPFTTRDCPRQKEREEVGDNSTKCLGDSLETQVGLHWAGPSEPGCLKGSWQVYRGFEHKGYAVPYVGVELGFPVSQCCLCPLEAVQSAGAHAHHVATLRRRASGNELKDSEKGSILSRPQPTLAWGSRGPRSREVPSLEMCLRHLLRKGSRNLGSSVGLHAQSPSQEVSRLCLCHA